MEHCSLGYIRIMSVIHIQSVRDPFDLPEVARAAVTTLARAEAMGLLPQGETIDVLDFPTLRKVVKGISRAGIGQNVLPDLAGTRGRDPKQFLAALQRLNDALDASPVPASEWPGLMNILGIDLLARLLGVSAVSVRRYASGTRPTPDDVAARLHFLALVVADLAGAYNDIGVRRWFDRERTLLGNKTPAQLLTRKWKPEDAGPQQVRQLAHALVSSPAT
ncbi:MAG: hypothetical protein AB7G75_17050 [Candidatus Binatia bacterium]